MRKRFITYLQNFMFFLHSLNFIYYREDTFYFTDFLYIEVYLLFFLPYFYVLSWTWYFWSHGWYFSLRIFLFYQFTGAFLYVYCFCLFMSRKKIEFCPVLFLVCLPLLLTSSAFVLVFVFVLRHDNLCHQTLHSLREENQSLLVTLCPWAL